MITTDLEQNTALKSLRDLIVFSLDSFIDLQSSARNTRERGSCDGLDVSDFPSRELFDVQRTLLGAAGKLTEISSSPSSRLLEVSSQYFESRSLHIAADKRIPDLIAKAPGGVLHVSALAAETGIDQNKLSRVIRCLCSIHVFTEAEPDTFSNNRISLALVDNEPLRAYLMLFGLDLYTASDHLPRYLSDPKIGQSYDVQETPWQSAVNTTKPRWEWLEEKVPVRTVRDGDCGSGGTSSAYPGPFGDELTNAIIDKADDQLIPRPEHKVFGLAMLGGGRITGEAHLHDYPWADLGNATVVDVGGGLGGFSLQLSQIYPSLNFVVQDRAPVLAQAESIIWPKENPSAMHRVKFQPHDFFQPNPIHGAEVYWLRYILHDWSDDYCVSILKSLRASMGPKSRILICDQVMNTTLGAPELESAPSPLPANYGYYTRYSHQRDLAMMSIINGIERTPREFVDVIERAGLKVKKIWDCRSQTDVYDRTTLIADHPDMLVAMNNLAKTLSAQGKTDEAVAIQSEVLEKSRYILGGEHLFTQLAMSNLAIKLERPDTLPAQENLNMSDGRQRGGAIKRRQHSCCFL